MQRVIGIDFGTSTTYMNVKRYNNGKPVEDKFSYMPVVFNYGESSGFVMSIVRENSDGTFDFGEKAAEPLDGARVYTEFKMRLESPDGQERGEARRITKEFFKFLYESYAQQANNLGSPDDTEETFVSYPVKWRGETAQFMLEAAREAGFQNVRGIDEASAAVSTVLCQSTDDRLLRSDKPGYLMLIDMGAGTTDLVVCRYEANPGGDGVNIKLVTSWPQSAEEPTFGGREIDAALEGYVEGYLARGLNPVLAPQAGAIAGTPGQAKLWKERNVSVNLGAGKTVDTCAYISIYKTTGMLNGDFPAFGRKEFETFIGSGLRDYGSLLMGCLAMASACDGDFVASGLDLVILTGGHSAWYFAREIVDGTMAGYLDHPMLDTVRRDKTRVIGLPNPQSTVSLGLVYSKLPFRLAKQEPEKESESAPKEETKQANKSAAQGGTAAYNVLLSAAEAFLDSNSMDGRSIINRHSRFSILHQKKVCDEAHPGCWIYRFYETGMFINDLQLWITSRGIYYGVSMFPLPDNDEFFEARAKELIPQPVKLASCNFLSWERFLDGRWHRLGGLIEAEEMQDYLEKLEVHLKHECAGMGLLSTDAALRWDDRLLPRIKEFIATYDKPLTEKFIVKPTDGFIERIRSRMYYGEKRTYSVEFYVGFDVSISWRDEFFILTNQGITCNISDNHHTSWPSFLEADAIRRDGNFVYCCHTGRLPFPIEGHIGYSHDEISEQFARFYCELQAYLRKCAAEL